MNLQGMMDSQCLVIVAIIIIIVVSTAMRPSSQLPSRSRLFFECACAVIVACVAFVVRALVRARYVDLSTLLILLLSKLQYDRLPPRRLASVALTLVASRRRFSPGSSDGTLANPNPNSAVVALAALLALVCRHTVAFC
jgi:hypothetical protein